MTGKEPLASMPAPMPSDSRVRRPVGLGRRRSRRGVAKTKILVPVLAIALFLALQLRSLFTVSGTFGGYPYGEGASRHHASANVSAGNPNHGTEVHPTTAEFRCPPPLEDRPDLAEGLPPRSTRLAYGLTLVRKLFGKLFRGRRPDHATVTNITRWRVYDDYKRRVDAKIASRPRHGRACPQRPVYGAEFGYELQGVVPWYYDEHVRLECDLHVTGMPGSRYVYYFAANFTQHKGRRSPGYLPKEGPMKSATPHVKALPTENWTMPPWRDFFSDGPLDVVSMFPHPKKPIAVVFNKYTTEWDEEPVNFLDVHSLRRLLTILTPIYQVVYVRMESSNKLGDSGEQQKYWSLHDKPMIRREYPGVVLLDDLYDEATMDYNLLLFGVCALSRLFVSVQGGNSVIASLFARPNFVYAVKGKEINTGKFRYGWTSQLSGGRVRVYNYREWLLEDVWRHVHCKREWPNGTVEGYVPEQRPLKERAFDKDFVP